jgi:hypothetical protein
MGADYYIIKRLRIVHSDGTDIIELEREKGYFPDSIYMDSDFDSDDSCYEEKIDKKIYDMYLKVKYKPRILYTECGGWKNLKIRDKYIDRIYDKLNHYNNAYENIHEVIKEEVRI